MLRILLALGAMLGACDVNPLYEPGCDVVNVTRDAPSFYSLNPTEPGALMSDAVDRALA